MCIRDRVTALPFLKEIAELGLDVILSTGASNLEEVATAVQTLRDHGVGELVLLHCVSSYPAPAEALNLSAIGTMRSAFGVPVGYSDHTNGSEAAAQSILCGASVVEKHITLDTRMEGPDHLASVTPDNFKSMVEAMQAAALVRGDGIKQPASCELPNLPLIRKSIVVRRSLPTGHVLKLEDLALKRPGSGIPPAELDKLPGHTLLRAYEIDEPLDWEGIE